MMLTSAGAPAIQWFGPIFEPSRLLVALLNTLELIIFATFLAILWLR
jgi:hypothetical protein